MPLNLTSADYQYMKSVEDILKKATRSGIQWKKTAFKDGTTKIEFPSSFPIPFIVVNSRLLNKVIQDSLIGLS